MTAFNEKGVAQRRNQALIDYRIISVDLAAARTDELHEHAGDMLLVTSISGTLDIKFDEKTKEALPLNRARKIETPFYRFYLTNTAQAGKTAELVIGRGLRADAPLVDIAGIGGTFLTGRDWSTDLKVLTDLQKGASNADALAGQASNVLQALSVLFGFNGTTFDRIRAANVFKRVNTVAVTTPTAIWTPAAGKKFRLMGFYLLLSLAGSVSLYDNAANLFDIPSAGTPPPIVVNLGQGFLSAAADNPLKAEGPGGSTVSGLVWGTEE